MNSSIPINVRPFVTSDAPSFLSAVKSSMRELCYWMPWCHSGYSLSDAESWIAHCISSWNSGAEFPLGIFDAVSGHVIGGTGFNHLIEPYRLASLGYWVSTPFTNKGVARGAARLAAKKGFDELGLTRIEIVILTNNPASQRVAQSLGATLECKARNRLYRDGQPQSAFVYSLVPGDLHVKVPV
jgi:ribosomal-protein-serine acetyltransferase